MGQQTNRIQLTKEEQNARILELHVEGMTERQIAKEIGLGKSTVNRRIKKILEDFREDNKDKLKNHKFVQLARLEKIILVSVRGYELSLKPHTTVTNRKGTSAKFGKYSEESIQVEDPRPNTNFLKSIVEAIKEQNKLLNLYDSKLDDGSANDLLTQIREITGRAEERFGDSA